MACSSTLLLPFKPSLHPQPSNSLSNHLPYRLSLPTHHPKKLHIHPFYRLSRGGDFFHEEEEEDDDEGVDESTFDEAVILFNTRDYYKCHDYLEALWNKAEEPKRTLIHGILQCAVGFHHLFGSNHRGAMMELGEGLCKLKKMNFESGPFYEFQKEISASLDFVYQTQLELAACTDDICLTMDGSQRSYQLLGSFAAGQKLYHLERETDDISYIVFCPQHSSGNSTRVKVPTLQATVEHLMACDYN